MPDTSVFLKQDIAMDILTVEATSEKLLLYSGLFHTLEMRMRPEAGSPQPEISHPQDFPSSI